MPNISVIMSVYKEPIEWMRLSIESILNQTYTDFEFLIVNDKPDRDENRIMLEEYARQDNRIKIISNIENIGLTKSLNKALSVASGKYIARMDADDISKPTRFEQQIQFMENTPNVIVVGTNFEYIGDNSIIKRTDQIRFDDRSIRAYLLFQNCIPHPTVMIRKLVLDSKKISYDEEYKHGQDYRMWEMLLPYGEFACLKERLLQYRFSKQQITASNRNSQKDYAGAVRTRLQKNWLNSIDYSFEEDEILNNPMLIINKLRKDNMVKNTLEYSSFLQYAYLNSLSSSWSLFSFILHDIRYFTFYNSIRTILRKIKE